jgi:integrase
MAEGIRKLHSRACAVRRGGRCDCRAGYEAAVFIARDDKKIRKTFPTLTAAKSWRTDMLAGVRRGSVRASRPVTVRAAADELLVGMRSGAVRTRSGEVYKPSVFRSYETALRLHVLPELGGRKLVDVQRRDVQRLADGLLANGRDPSTVRNALMPLRVIYRRALEDGDVAVNPCSGLRLPALRGQRDRIVSPEQASALLAALRNDDRVVWALALYAGLRRGELMALRWEDVDLASGIIRVERSWDDKARVFVEPKSRAGRRRVPVAGVLRDLLVEHKLRRRGVLVVPGLDGGPFRGSAFADRALRAWKRVGLETITLHEARHTFASMMIAAGVNARALASYMGHSSVTITYDRYGHLMPGNEDEAAALLDVYLERANTRARLAAIEPDA